MEHALGSPVRNEKLHKGLFLTHFSVRYSTLNSFITGFPIKVMGSQGPHMHKSENKMKTTLLSCICKSFPRETSQDCIICYYFHPEYSKQKQHYIFKRITNELRHFSNQGLLLIFFCLKLVSNLGYSTGPYSISCNNLY